MKSEIFDYQIEYFDKDFKQTEIRYVLDTRFNKKHCETTFYYISEVDENNKVTISSITYPYTRVLSFRLLIYELVDEVLIERNESVENIKHSYVSKNITPRGYRGLKRRWR